MINELLAVALGGASGSVVRYVVGAVMPVWVIDYFPLHTFIVNIVGCFLIGFLSGLMSYYWFPSHTMKAFLITGFLGGFTTFSSFALDFGVLVSRGTFIKAFFYLFSTLFIGLSAFFLGEYFHRIVKAFNTHH